MVQFNPLLPEFLADPYPFYQRLREQDPVHWNQVLGFGMWVLTRYADVMAVLRDPRFSAQRRSADVVQEVLEIFPQEGEMSPLVRANTMLSSDPPDHTRMRTLVNKAFTPRAVEAMRPRIQAIVDSLLDAAQERGGMDVIADLAYPLPVIVIAEMLGVPPEDRDQFKRWSDDVVTTIEPVLSPEAQQRAQRASLELAEYFRGIVEVRRREPRDDLLSALIAAEEQGDRLTEDELYATCILLLVAGNETTTNLIGNGMLALLRHPDQLQRLREEPSLLEPAVEEMLRYESPVQLTARVALTDVEVGGRTVGRGQLVLTVLGAANRDPAQFPEPDRFDVARRDNRHLAFGHGIHYCLGAPLARLEAQVAFRSLLARFPRLEPAFERPQWRPAVTLRGLATLPVRF